MENNPHLNFNELPERNIAVLRVNGGLALEDRKVFQSLCAQLLSSRMEKKVIDLSRVTGIFSIYYGSIADLCQQAGKTDKPITVLVNPRIHDLFQKANLEDLVSMVQVPSPAP